MSHIQTKMLPNGQLRVRCKGCGKELITRPNLFGSFKREHENCYKKKEMRSLGSHYGLGDLIEKATQFIGVPTCSGCERRKRFANKIMPKVLKKR